jgi:hypothetical protein
MLPKRGPSEKRDGNCHFLADSRWEMLLKAVGQPLGTARRVLEAAEKCPKAIGKPRAILKGKAAGKSPNTHHRPIGEEAELPSGCWQIRGNFHHFSLNHRISV